MSAFESDEFIYFDSASAVSDAHEIQIENGSVYGQIIWPNSHMDKVFFHNFRNTESSN